MKPRHLRRGGKHLPRPAPYQGWGPDPVDELAQAQSGHTPPMGFPKVVVPATSPRLGWPLHVRLAVAAGVMCFGLVLGAFAILTVAFLMGAPEPAQAEAPVQDDGVTVVVDDGKIRVRDGIYTLERKR